MKPGIPWSVKGIEPDVREAAKQAARRSGMTLGEWLNSTILEQADDGPASQTESRPLLSRQVNPTQNLERTASRLEDIAEQLAVLSRRETGSAAAPLRTLADEQAADTEALQRVLARVESNERQTVEAFTAVNDRLSAIGRQVAQGAQAAQAIQASKGRGSRLEEEPGYLALEKAVRNIVEHMESSEKRNRDNFKSLQDRLASMSSRAMSAPHDQVLREAPAFTQLESRLADLVRRVEQTENAKPLGSVPDLVRREIAELAGRIDTVRDTAEALANRAQTQAVQASQQELRAIEQRIIGLIHEAQSSLATNTTGPAELQRLRAEIDRINTRIEDASRGRASGGDVLALKVAVEQLSTRVAQGPDLGPLADMDQRIADLAQRLEHSQGEAHNPPYLGELEHRLAELDHKLDEALGGHAAAAAELHDRLEDVARRVDNTERQLTSIEGIERAVHQLFEGIEQQKEWSRQTAIEAAENALGRMAEQMALHSNQQGAAPHSLAAAPEIQALQQGLHAVRSAADSADHRNQETLEAVHETLEQIVTKLTELESTAIIQRQVPVASPEPRQAYAPPYAPEAAEPEELPAWASITPQEQVSPAQQFHQEPQQEPEPVLAAAPSGNPFEQDLPEQDAAEASGDVAYDDTILSGREAMQAGAIHAENEDFIAEARKAAQSSFHQKSILSSVAPELARASEEGSRKLMSFGFSKRRAAASAPAKKVNPGLSGEITYPPGFKPPADQKSGSKRRLIFIGLALLAIASVYTFNMMGGVKKFRPAVAPVTTEQSVSPSNSTVGDDAAPQGQPIAPGGAAPDAVAPTGPQGSSAPLSDPPVEQEGMLGSVRADGIFTSAMAAEPPREDLASLISGEPATGAQMPASNVGTAALRQAAASGNAKAQFVVATRYLNGEQGAPQDESRAAYWYGRAAVQGLAPAQYRLGTLYERGKGVARDFKAARSWYVSAARLGNVKAMYNAAVLAASKDAGTPDYAVAYKWFSEGAAHGLKDSQFNLAVLFERGLGTRANATEALFWYAAAAAQNDAEAAKRAALLEKQLGPSVVAATNARLKAWKPAAIIDAANVVAVNQPAWNASGTTG